MLRLKILTSDETLFLQRTRRVMVRKLRIIVTLNCDYNLIILFFSRCVEIPDWHFKQHLLAAYANRFSPAVIHAVVHGIAQCRIARARFYSSPVNGIN